MKLNPSNAAIIKRLLVGRNSRPLRSVLSKIEPADLASLFSTLNSRERRLFFEALISLKKATETLLEVPEPQLEQVLCQLDHESLSTVIVYSDEGDAAYFLNLMKESKKGEVLAEQILAELEAPKRDKIQRFMNYPEDSAGRMMQSRVFCLPTSMTAADGLEVLRQRAQHESIYYIYCVEPTTEDPQSIWEPGAKRRLAGIISLRQLATAPANTELSDIIRSEVITVSAHTPADEVAQQVAHYDFIAIPVVDDEKNLLGIITVDDVVDIIQEQATAKLYAQAGLQEDDRVFTPTKTSIKKRLPWMFLNLLLAAIASSVVSLFEDTMNHLIILATLKNIVAGMGGNTAIQTLTVVTRGLATGDFSFINYTKAIVKETIAGTTIGVLTGLGAGLITFVWKGNLMVSVVICLSMIINSVLASAAGATVPILLKESKRDPATGAGVLVTMFTDIFSFFSFLGIATLGLHYFT